MKELEDLAAALRRVPAVLLDTDEAKVLEDGLHAIEALDGGAGTTPRILFVGPSGSGRSWLVNGLAGEDVSPTGHLRPTTRDVIEAQATISGHDVVLVDTPPWEHARREVRELLATASVGVVVISPTRYADASVSELLADARAEGPTVVALNSLGDQPHTAVIDDATSVTGPGLVRVATTADLEILRGVIGDSLEADGDAQHAVIRAAAAGAGRFVASTVTERSTALGQLTGSVRNVDTSAGSIPLTVLETWPDTAQGIVRATAGLRDGLDHEIGLSGDRELFDRVLESLPPWDADRFTTRLRDWKDDTEASFVANARIRWRKRSARILIADAAWRAGANPAVTVHPRVRRLLGDRLSDVVVRRYDALVRLLDDEVEARRADWLSAVEEAAEYTPGELLGAVEALESGG